jgi:hypothetical protein
MLKVSISFIVTLYLTAIGLTPSGSSTVHNYTQTTQNTENGTNIIKNRNIRVHNNKKMLEMRTVPCLCELCPGICLTTEEKARKPSVSVAGYFKTTWNNYLTNDISSSKNAGKSTLPLFLNSTEK